jgi:hypothetical protein
MRRKIILAGLALGICGFAISAQDQAPQVFPNNVYCSGIVTTEAVPRDTYVITGEEANGKIVFNQNDYVYINKGSSQGAKVGDKFSVVRPQQDVVKIDWTKWQSAILKKMGTMWEDEGTVTLVDVRADVSIAKIDGVCGYLQRNDVVLPFIQRPEPPLKAEVKFDEFAPSNGKPMAMVITGKAYQQQIGKNDIVYVNLGNSQGVKVGDYFRIFRYTGTQHETDYQTPRFAFDVDGDWGPVYGFGAAPKKWDWNNTPREVLGEGVVLRTGPNSATVLVTFSKREMFAGDYVELE